MGDQATDIATTLAVIRTHLANERTFAAWVRTGLSVAAAGIAVARVSEPVPMGVRLLAAVFILVGSGMMIFGGARFGRVASDLGRTSHEPVRLTRHIAFLLVALMAFLVFCTFVVLV